MRRIVIAAMAAGALLAGCGSSGQSTESSAVPTPPPPVESASASGSVAAADSQACRSGPPISPPEGYTFDEDDGVFGTLSNETGSTLWVSMDWNLGTSWCRLDAGRGAAFGAGKFINLRVSVGNGSASYPGVTIYATDPWIGSPKVKTQYETSTGGICQRDQSILDTGSLEENEENWLNGKAQGSIEVKRLPDSKAIAREWTGTSKADDWARIDLRIRQMGVCS